MSPERLQLQPQAKSQNQRLQYRQYRKYLQDTLDGNDLDFELCRKTGFSVTEIVHIISVNEGNRNKVIEALGYSSKNRNKFNKFDNGYWRLLCGWIRNYFIDFDRVIKKICFMDNEIVGPDLDKVADILGITSDTLAMFIENKETIDAFLVQQRSLLGTIAELQLWKLVNAGDPATVRWVLSKIKTDIFGKSDISDAKDTSSRIQTIKVIDIDGRTL